MKENQKSVDPAAQVLLKMAGQKNILTAYERAEKMKPCPIGHQGACCKMCHMGPKRQLDVLVRSMTNSDAPSLVLGTDFNDVGANFSPDGRWISYQSDQSGQWEVYVRAVTPSGQPEAGGGAPAGQWQVSSGGGTFARWGADGRELFYVGANGSMMAVPITVQGATFDVGAPVALFSMASLGGANVQFDVAPDGRFLINGVVGDAVSPPIVLVQHWAPEARR